MSSDRNVCKFCKIFTRKKTCKHCESPSKEQLDPYIEKFVCKTELLEKIRTNQINRDYIYSSSLESSEQKKKELASKTTFEDKTTSFSAASLSKPVEEKKSEPIKNDVVKNENLITDPNQVQIKVIPATPQTAKKTSTTKSPEPSDTNQSNGIKCLNGLDKVIIDNKIEVPPQLKALPYSILNHYVVKSESNQKCLLALEESIKTSSCCMKRTRGFKIHLFDIQLKEAMMIERSSLACGCCAHLSWFTCWGNCCSFTTVVKSSKGQVLGEIRQSKSCCKSAFEILNEDRDLRYRVQCQSCKCNCTCCSCGDEFKILGKREKLVLGEIVKQKGKRPDGKSMRNYPYYNITYPKPCSLQMKAVLLASTFVIDVMYYESMRKK